MIGGMDLRFHQDQFRTSYSIGSKLFFTLQNVSDHRFVAVKDKWIDGIGPDGLIYVYASMEGSERVSFFESLSQFVNL